MSLTKNYSQNREMCKVTFTVTEVMVGAGSNVHLVGEFNEWKIHDKQLKKLKNGDFTITLELKTGRDYQFRYLVDDATWVNDWNADKYVGSKYGNCHNSVVSV